MKNILHYIQIALLGFLITVPFTLSAMNNAAQPNLNVAIQPQETNLSGDSSETSLTDPYKDTSVTNMPRIQLSNPFPNPASSFVKIDYKFPSISDNGELRIMDLTGKTVLTYPLAGTNNSLRINVSDLTRGLYFCTIYYKGQLVKSNKLIVSNQ